MKFECNSCGEVCQESEVRHSYAGRSLCPLCGRNVHPLGQGASRSQRYKKTLRSQKAIRDQAASLALQESIPFHEAKERVVRERRKKQRSKNAHKITAFGKTRTVREWVDSTACPYSNPGALYTRVFKLGWDPEKAIETPTRDQDRRD